MLSQRHSGRQTETDAQSKAPRKTDQDRCSVKGTQEDRLGRRQEDKEGRRPRAEKSIMSKVIVAKHRSMSVFW